MIIGLSGYGRTGKDTVGLYLVDEYDYCRRAFADPLKEAVLALNPLISDSLRVEDVVRAYGWDVAKSYPEVRRLLQRFGTEFGRKMMGESFWVDISTKNLDIADHVVFTDVRFPSEAQKIVDLGGQVWRVHRKGYGPVNDHASEVAMDDWNFGVHIYNYGTKSDLRNSVRLAMDELHRNSSTVPA